MKPSDFEKMKFIAEIKLRTSGKIIRQYFDQGSTRTFEIDKADKKFREIPHGNWQNMTGEESK